MTDNMSLMPCFSFLGTNLPSYSKTCRTNINVRRSGEVKRGGGGGKGNVTKRTLNNHTQLVIPLNDKIHKFIFSKGIAKQKQDGTLFPIHRNSLLKLSDLEIVSAYNAELRGICNYYGMASNYHKLKYFVYLMKFSCLKTLAAKHKSSISKVVAMFADGKGS